MAKPTDTVVVPAPDLAQIMAAKIVAKQITDFQERVYTLLLQVPAGKVTTYAALSKALNASPRAVGGAMRNNPYAPAVPCHRCIASNGVSTVTSILLVE
jgi:O-6-methylguanine DNA methyltransferase